MAWWATTFAALFGVALGLWLRPLLDAARARLKHRRRDAEHEHDEVRVQSEPLSHGAARKWPRARHRASAESDDGALRGGAPSAPDALQEDQPQPPPPTSAVKSAAWHSSVCDAIGGTSLVPLRALVSPAARARGVELLGKLECENPGGSVKDRVALAMIEAAEARGEIAPGRTTLVEATSGNTGVALAMVAAARGYALVVVMPRLMPMAERYNVLSLIFKFDFLTN